MMLTPTLLQKQNPNHQRGISLLELLVGLSIGLLITAIAMVALMASRSVSSTVSDVSQLQQQAAYTLRVIGQQLRQAGSLYLNPTPTGGSDSDVLGAVVFEVNAQGKGGGKDFTLSNIISGNSESITTGFRRYQDNVFLAANASNTSIGTDFLARNCIGSPANTNTDEVVESTFTLANGNLRCGGNGAAPQPITQNVAQFQVSYLAQPTSSGVTAIQHLSTMPTGGASPWQHVQGVQICFVLFGNEVIDMPAGSSYTDCNGDSVDMTSLPPPRTNRLHRLFRNTFQLRSQGLPTS